MNQFFEKLVQKIKNKDKVIIMTHKNMDLDGFSASLCLYQIICELGKKCFLYLNKKQSNDDINKTMEKLESENYKYNCLYKDDLKSFNFDNTLLIVVDIYKKHLVENEKLLEMVKDIVVIDHHIQDIDYISNASLCYVNSEMSSVAEIMVNFCKYLNFKTDNLLATILLCAMQIDTNYFNFKTTAKTYEAAAFLTRCGASTIIKQELLRESKDTYMERQFYIEQSYQITDNIILCTIEDKIVSASYLAIVADSLLQFENIEASFCVGRLDASTVGISARSIGNINVQTIMHKLGGGGHKTDAATKIENTRISDSVEKLINIIREEQI